MRRCARDASVVLVNSKETGEVVRRLGKDSGEIGQLSQTFLTSERIGQLAAPLKEFPGPGQEVRMLACGTLEGLKGVALTLHALARCAAEGLAFRYRFLGKGSELGHLEALAWRLGLESRVSLGDWLVGNALTEALRSAHLYVAPSLREGVPVSLIEAMAAHCVPVVADCGGPGMVVTPDCGIALPAHSPEQLIRDLADTIRGLATDPERCQRLAHAAHLRGKERFSEEAYAAGVEAAYG
ncbi:MAG: glycosyltransferase family 4 protein, partial [Terrimicrobiaceae bacterium]|nr:glycosyltransferase family 4 protein [Terrimicrobiaceae bacterium]